MRATDTIVDNRDARICIRLGSLCGVLKALCIHQNVSLNDEIRDMVAAVLARPDALNLLVIDDDDRIRINLGALRADFAQWCEQRGLTEKAGLRLVAAQKFEQLIWSLRKDPSRPIPSSPAQIGLAATPGQAIVGVQEEAHEPSRLRLRLKASELEAVTRLAEQRRISPQRLVTHLLRAFLLKSAVFSEQETVDMGAVNLSLMRIGNNLNQIAKQLNAYAASTSRPGEGAYSEFEAIHLEIRQCLAQLDNHVKTCANALALSRERWRIELKD